MRAAIVLLGVVALAACAGEPPAEPAVELPDLGDWKGEPAVADRVRAARKAALASPADSRAVGRLGMVFHAHDIYREAIDCYRRAMELDPEEVRWPYLAALAAAKTDFEGSVAFFDRAVELTSRRPVADHAAVYINHGDVLAQLGRGEEAEAHYRRALELAPEATHALYGLARLELSRDRPEAALSQLERAAGIVPWQGEIHTLLAQAYRRLGRHEQAELAQLRAGAFPTATRAADPIAAAMEAEAVSMQAVSRRGQQLADKGRFEEAEAQFRRVLELGPGNQRDLSNLGGALSGQDRHEEAIEIYLRALAMSPDDTYTLNNLGLALASQGRLDEAATRLGRAVEIDPTYADAHHNLGLVRARQGRQAQAIEHYRAAIAANPSLVQAYNNLGTALALNGELAEAVEHWRRGLEIDGRQLPALYNLAVALAQQGNHGEAVGWLRRGLETAPNSSRLVSLLAWELATAPDPALRDGTEAVALASRVHQAYPDQPAIGDVLAAGLAEQGRFDEAIGTATRARDQARVGGQAALAEQIDRRLTGYRAGRPFRQPA